MSLPTPRLSTRGTAGYSFAELYLARGPQALGETGDNSLPTLIGRVWALVLDADGRLRLFQRAELAATWVEQTTLLPPLFAETHPPERRRFSIAFDQSARANVAYEEDGVVYLTRWDTTANGGAGGYVQNVTVAGVDPVVVFDATWAYNVTESDVLVFYLSPDRTRLLARVQRQLYATEVELHDYGAPVVLDRVTRLPLRYQALASDEAGDPLEDDGARVGLLSDLYPYPASDTAQGRAYTVGPFGHSAELYENPLVTEEPIAARVFLEGPFGHADVLYAHPLVTDEPIAARVFLEGTWTHESILYAHPVTIDEPLETRAFLEGTWTHTLTLFATLANDEPLEVRAFLDGTFVHKEA